jgi:putative redox protein
MAYVKPRNLSHGVVFFMINAKLNHIYQTTITRPPHTLLSDVASKLGGEDQGMNPHELLEGALGACTLMTMQMYGQRKGWDLTGTEVDVKIIKEGKESLITREIRFSKDLGHEEKVRLLEIADRCPIHRLLTSDIKIETSSS